MIVIPYVASHHIAKDCLNLVMLDTVEVLPLLTSGTLVQLIKINQRHHHGGASQKPYFCVTEHYTGPQNIKLLSYVHFLLYL